MNVDAGDGYVAKVVGVKDNGNYVVDEAAKQITVVACVSLRALYDYFARVAAYQAACVDFCLRSLSCAIVRQSLAQTRRDGQPRMVYCS